jgi:hypothetical protein
LAPQLAIDSSRAHNRQNAVEALTRREHHRAVGGGIRHSALPTLIG